MHQTTIPIAEACNMCNRVIGYIPARNTVYKWASKHGVGYQLPSGQWRFLPDRLNAFLKGEEVA